MKQTFRIFPDVHTTGGRADGSRATLATRAIVLPDLTFVIEVGPITDDEHLVVRWKARGTYCGGFPGAPPEAIGRTITFTGTDTLRVADGKLAEYWTNADSLLFVQQPGVREIPARG